MIDLIPSDARATPLAVLVSDLLRMVGFSEPLQMFSSPNRALSLADARAITDGATVEVTFTMAAPPDDFESIEYWITVDLPEDVIEPSPLIVYGTLYASPEVEAYVHAANHGIYFYGASVEYLDELTRRVTVRIPEGWETPDSMVVFMNGYLDPDRYLLNIGSAAIIPIAPVDAVETRGLQEPGPIEHLTSVPDGLDSLWRGTSIEWSHPLVRATVMAPDNWIASSLADGIVLWGWDTDPMGERHSITLVLREFDPGDMTASALLDEFLALSEGGFTELDRITEDSPPFDEVAIFGTTRDFELASGLTAAAPEGWYSTADTITFLGVVTLDDDRVVLAIVDYPPGMYEAAARLIGDIEILQ